MADERYKSVSTFALPDEYQRQASEARRRRRMAEMLAQQAYQPGDIQNAPIPRGAPLVQGLQAYLTARAARKADEAEESAAETQIREAKDLLDTLTRPREDFDKTMNLKEALQLGTPELVDGQLQYPDMTASSLKMIPQAGPQVQLGRKPEDDQVYMPAAVSRFTATGRETDPQRMAEMLANPQFKSGFTDEQLLKQRLNLTREAMLTSENPMVQKVAGAIYPTLQPEKIKLQLGNINPADFTPASIADAMKFGDVSKLQPIAKGGAAPTELARLIEEMNNLPPNSPLRKKYEQRIEKETRIAGPSVVTYGTPMPAVDAEGNPVFIQPSRSGGAPSVLPGYTPPVTRPPLNETQSNSAGFADRISNALPELERISPLRSSIIAEELPLGMGASSVSDEDKRFFQAERSFINAVLRKESGAAIGKDEFESARRQYIPLPGDGPQTLERKRIERQTALQNMNRAAGPSYQNSSTQPVAAPVTPISGKTRRTASGVSYTISDD